MLVSAPLVIAGAAPDLKPLLAVPDQVVLHDDFSNPGPLNKEQWGARQGTRWTIVEGVLRGISSSEEFQASKTDHQGNEPRISAPVTPPQFIAKFSVRFSGGKESPGGPFVEFGHHVARVKFDSGGLYLMVGGGDAIKLAETKEFKYEPGKWYHALAELKGEEFVIQFADGPVLYAKHPRFALPNEKGSNGLGIAGAKDGMVEIDDVTLWSIKPEAQPGWSAKRDSLPKFTPVPVEEKKKAKKSKK